MALRTIFKPGHQCGGAYDITNLIHRGPNTETYKAIHRITRQATIVTCSRFLHVDGDPPSKAAFNGTAEKLAALAIADLPRIYGHGVNDGVYWVASQLLDEPTALEYSAQRKSNSPEWLILDALAIAIRVRAVLEKAHALDVLHGNLRPASIRIRGLPNDCDPTLVELGFADLFVLNRTAARANPRYRPPEQIAGDPIDARSDIYSLGMVLYHLIAQAPPYDDKTPVSTSPRLIEMALRELPTPLPELHKHCPTSVWEFVAKAIDKNPAKRFQSTDELEEALEDLTNEVLSDRRIGAFVREQERKLAAHLQAREQATAANEARHAPRHADGAEPTTVPPGADTKRRIQKALAQARAGGLAGDASPSTPRSDGQPSSAPRSAEPDPDSEPVTLPSAHQGAAKGPRRAPQPPWRLRVALAGAALAAGGLAALVAVTHGPARPSAAVAWHPPPMPAPMLPEATARAPAVTTAPTPGPTASASAPHAPAVTSSAAVPRIRHGAAPTTKAPEPAPSGSASDPCMSTFLCPGADPLTGSIPIERVKP